MAKIYVAEFPGLAAAAQSDSVALVYVPPTLEQTLAVSSIATTSNAFQPSTQFVEISTDTVCSIAFSTNAAQGTSIAATASNCRLNGGERVLRRVPQGSAVSVISNT